MNEPKINPAMCDATCDIGPKTCDIGPSTGTGEFSATQNVTRQPQNVTRCHTCTCDTISPFSGYRRRLSTPCHTVTRVTDQGFTCATPAHTRVCECARAVRRTHDRYPQNRVTV
jgi:hypothetical protein